MTTAIARRDNGGELLPPAEVARMLEQVIVRGNLSVLSANDKVRYYSQVCGVIGIPVELRPFEYITLNGREVLYVLRSCTEWLRDQRGIACRILERTERPDGIYEVVVEVEDRTGRKDFASGLVDIKGLTGEKKANAIMKAETKAKRRATLSISGLGMLDESEIEHPGRSGAASTAPTVIDSPAPFTPWHDDDIPDNAKKCVGVITSYREVVDSKGPLLSVTIAMEGDGGTIEALTRNMAAFASVKAATDGRVLLVIRFSEIKDRRKLLSLDEPPAPANADGTATDPETGKLIPF